MPEETEIVNKCVEVVARVTRYDVSMYEDFVAIAEESLGEREQAESRALLACRMELQTIKDQYDPPPAVEEELPQVPIQPNDAPPPPANMIGIEQKL